jgi:predicted nucleic acid-binding Zn ribbon protein
MSIINCPECGYHISDKAEKCSKCSYPIQKNKQSEGLFLQSLNFGCMFILVTVGVIVLFFVLSVIFS